MYPGISAMWGQWAPPMERSTLAMISYTGYAMERVSNLAAGKKVARGYVLPLNLLFSHPLLM